MGRYKQYNKNNTNNKSNKYEQQCKDRLKKIVDKKFTTAIIGALAAFEDKFGDIWGHFEEYDEDLTESQKKYEKVWEDVRNEILNQGNHQKRVVLEEIDNHDVNWKRYKTDFIIRR